MKDNSYKRHIEGIVDKLIDRIKCEWFMGEDAKLITSLLAAFEESFMCNPYWKFTQWDLKMNEQAIIGKLCKTVCHLQLKNSSWPPFNVNIFFRNLPPEGRSLNIVYFRTEDAIKPADLFLFKFKGLSYSLEKFRTDLKSVLIEAMNDAMTDINETV